VLQSRTLMDKVVKSLHLYAPVYEVGKIKTSSAYTISPVIIEAKDPDSIKKVKNINLDFDSIESIVILDEINYPLEKWVDTPYGTIKFIANKNYIVPGEKKPLNFSLIPPQEI